MQSPSRRRTAKFIAAQLAAGEPVRRVAKVLAAYLSDNNQLRSADLMLRSIEEALLHNHGILLADITSAHDLSQHTVAELRRMLEHDTGARQVEISSTIDPSLIGGVIVRTPDAEMDSSLRSRLRKLGAI